eukprot:Colp12_sorted_trinity150504_noHs@20795
MEVADVKVGESDIQLANTRLKEFPIYEEIRNNGVKQIDVRFNYLSTLTVAHLQNFTGLKKLLLNANDLLELPPLGQCLPQLAELHVSNNKIRKIGDSLRGLRNLTFLTLRANQIQVLEGLQDLVSLKSASFSCNKISKIIEDDIPVLPSLSFFGFFGNQVFDLQVVLDLLQKFPQLKELSMAHFSFLKAGVTKGAFEAAVTQALPHLEWLDGEQIPRPASTEAPMALG